ncbi:MAG TPA: methyltransferase domain-containing protein [Kofleriaceae bacterium]|nr:methyltransferase domain-containing protein [Kofleriaceae bacterium]
MVESTPESFRGEQGADFAKHQLQGRPRILHVGRPACSVPGRLADVGFAVTATAGEELATLDDSFDAIVFSHALSTAESLDTTIEHAARLLSATGRLVVDDIDAQAIDMMSARWFYDLQELLAVTGLYPSDRVHRPNADPIARWRDGTRADGIAHSGTEMRIAISARFAIRDLKRVEGFYRHISDGLPADSRGAAVASHVRGVERRLIASDALLPVGLRVVADRTR